MTKDVSSDLFFTCSLIEKIGRMMLLERGEVVKLLGRENISRIYDYADVFHCEPIEKVASEFIEEVQIQAGNFDNVKACKYDVPDYWTIGKVFSRLIEDIYAVDCFVDGIIDIYTSWIEKHISNYNTDFYYQGRDYIAACYQEKEIL